MVGTRSGRCGRGEGTSSASLGGSSSRQQQIQRVKKDKEVDPDHELIHSHPPTLLHHRSRRAMLQEKHLAFASIDASSHAEKRQYAGMSSAAACIVLELPTMNLPQTKNQSSVELSFNNKKRRTPVPNREVTKWRKSTDTLCYRFKPVYTHQFFTDELIQGYQPTIGAFKEALSVSGGGHHPSFAQLSEASNTLSIQVRLAPSCRKCCLIVEVGKVRSNPKQKNTKNVDSCEENRVVDRRAKSGRGKNATLAEITSCAQNVPTSSLSDDDGGSWDGDDEEDNEEFELRKEQGSKKRRRSQTIMPNPTGARSISLRSGRRRVGDLHMIGESDSKPAASKKCSRTNSSKCTQLTQTQQTRLVTDVSDSPSSDEEMESPPTSTSYDRSSSPVSATTSSASLAKMKMGTIITQLSAGLPEVVAVLLKDVDGGSSYKVLESSANSVADIENDYLDEPMGKVIREYTREKTSMSLNGSGGIPSPSSESDSSRKSSSKSKFILTLADMRTDKDARKYHDEVEKISQWFIEIASCVEFGLSEGVESDGGYWKVLYLFEKHRKVGERTKYSFVGYVTLFYHGHQMTVCQAVCLPSYQRSGHGTEMLMAAYEVCENREILVESPAPAFVALRNRVDYALVSKLIDQNQTIPEKFTQSNLLLGMKECDLPGDVLIKVGNELHITPRQVKTAYDIWKLGQLENTIQTLVKGSMSISLVNATISSFEVTFKSSFKRSLLNALRKNKEDLDIGSMGWGDQCDYLEERFSEAIVCYRSILK